MLTWREATGRALYGLGGFYRREQPGNHFRTSVHASPLFADAVAALVRDCGARIVVDVGAGGGELLRELHGQAPDLDLVGVDLAARPAQLPDSIRWTPTLGDLETPGSVGPPPYPSRDHEESALVDVLVIANEWLDDVPVDVVEVDETGRVRRVEVDPLSGVEQLGAAVDGADADWLARWWPLDDAEPGARAEIGRTRDRAWADAVATVGRGVLVAIDYSHRRSDRPPAGTLVGYRAGRMVAPVPDGSCDITAHVALDSCASAGAEAGATATMLTTQRRALRALGVDAALPLRPSVDDDPRSYLAALSRASQAAELLDPAGLGAFGWLVQAVGRQLPATLAGLIS
ncbi:MAG TPA: SAM-dependent methyltransferase [Jiangellaceae bacterium]|jgi:SAM-dependent MidA family methyltransferase|nr:SAM-dependent methyltransferase [Jiangellaceae bacterium]